MSAMTEYDTIADEAFHRRLMEINKEMNGFLERTDRERNDLACRSAAITRALAGGYVSADADASPDGGTATPHSPTTFLLEQQVGKMCSVELSKWLETQLPAAVERLVGQQVERHAGKLEERLRRVEQQQADLARRLDAAEERQKRAEAAAPEAAARAEREMHAYVEERLRERETQRARWADEMARMRDAVEAARAAVAELEGRSERRLEAHLRRQHEALQDARGDMEATVATWKQDLARGTRVSIATLQQQRDALEDDVGRLHGMLTSTAHTATRCAADLATLMEERVEAASEVRRCRQDVNRLELLVQCSPFAAPAADTVPGPGGRLGSPGASHSMTTDAAGRGAGGSFPPVVLVQELFRAKEAISFLSGRIESMERHLQRLDGLLATRGAAVVSPGVQGHPSTASGTASPHMTYQYPPPPPHLQQQQQQRQQPQMHRSISEAASPSEGTIDSVAPVTIASADRRFMSAVSQLQQPQQRSFHDDGQQEESRLAMSNRQPQPQQQRATTAFPQQRESGGRAQPNASVTSTRARESLAASGREEEEEAADRTDRLNATNAHKTPTRAGVASPERQAALESGTRAAFALGSSLRSGTHGPSQRRPPPKVLPAIEVASADSGSGGRSPVGDSSGMVLSPTGKTLSGAQRHGSGTGTKEESHKADSNSNAGGGSSSSSASWHPRAAVSRGSDHRSDSPNVGSDVEEGHSKGSDAKESAGADVPPKPASPADSYISESDARFDL